MAEQKSIQELSNEIRKLKQDIIAKVPFSGGNIINKQGIRRDVIFFMKTPGYDAILGDDGTVIRRYGFGSEKKTNRYGGYIQSYKTLIEEGYRPYPIFVNVATWNSYEEQHADARKQIAKSREFFPQIERLDITKKQVQERPLSSNIIVQRSPYNRPMSERPKVSIQKIAEADDFSNLFKHIDEFNKRSAQVKIKSNVLDLNQYANWMGKMYAIPGKIKNFGVYSKTKLDSGIRVPVSKSQDAYDQNTRDFIKQEKEYQRAKNTLKEIKKKRKEASL